MAGSCATIVQMTTAAARLHLGTSLEDVAGLPVPTLKMLGKERFATVGDLLLHLPARHEDRRRMEFKGFAPSLEPVCHHVHVLKARTVRFGRRSGFFEADVEAAQGNPLHQQLTLRWFNMPFMNRVIAVDMELMVYGKIKEMKGRLVMGHPEYEILRGDDDDGGAQIHTGRIVPIYPLRGGLKQKPLRAAVWRVLESFDGGSVTDLLPKPKADGEFANLSRGKALRDVHFPGEMPQLELARRYLALEEFYVLQLRVLRRRQRWRAVENPLHQTAPGQLEKRLLESLPFALTSAQRRSLNEIEQDMDAVHPMNRLLHGDVGSGKTVVAFAAMLHSIEGGRQAALMAPTQILAEQHFANARRWLEPLGMRVALRTGEKNVETPEGDLFAGPRPSSFQETRSTKEKGKGFWQTTSGPHVIIGTHALLHEKDALPHLGLVVIDEQHKFGVAQRARLMARGERPDVLVMTATPIPRTLALTVYGDLDVSTIDEKPSERGAIVTRIQEKKSIRTAAKFVTDQLVAGRQAYIVFPLIDESETLDAAAALTGLKEWSGHLEPHATGLLHGRMGAEEKDAVMRRFRAGEVRALVSTTVIEVGVDVPNATVMVIHNAERFGLAQLHQLRGRIGRGAHESHCLLLIPDKDTEARQRLEIMEQTCDGFRIAEEDLRRRGPGDLLGQAQSGQAPLRFAELLADTRLLTLARRLAERTLQSDPCLTGPAHIPLKELLGSDEPEVSALQ